MFRNSVRRNGPGAWSKPVSVGGNPSARFRTEDLKKPHFKVALHNTRIQRLCATNLGTDQKVGPGAPRSWALEPFVGGAACSISTTLRSHMQIADLDFCKEEK